MESAGTRIILKQLKKYNILKDVKEIIKDQDNKSVSVFKEFGVSHLERFDPGHVSKISQKILQSSQLLIRQLKFSTTRLRRLKK
ncbi:hypothetical protein TVAG_457550 [Trichomonas vaginalis G3]|uniref:Uncharacterized protein n=1 Tax=Trichomonas vaginalis (strain ATCC PRA-98 / G3) TaxID=412133 RepID=A2DC78_TRIV3|nr:hypothetical protein TVAGG3_0262450 [Trichomonas vaginalis G3]EAY22119.1 hypothetical protein TVAG_457550 [Trichomonas vaginalis G3]KAI5525214.1 hypothetical protein TVAGG3_0262450 [Trichomonas vaginalis G3]|eukprot:XP_001583105.1 hypothetical protein [Trichomonas vaginalis G3]